MPMGKQAMTSGRISSRLAYPRALGTAMLGLLGDRQGVHLSPCRQDPPEMYILRHAWLAAMSEKDDELLADHLVEQELFNHAAFTEADRRLETSAGHWSLPCAIRDCDFGIDLPLPPAPHQLLAQAEVAGVKFFGELQDSSVRSAWAAARILHRGLFATLCNIPHYLALFLVSHDGITLLRTSTDWTGTHPAQDGLAPLLRSMDEIVTELVENELAFTACSIDAASLARMLCPAPSVDGWELAGNSQPDGTSLDRLRWFLIWDRLGRPPRPEPVDRALSLLDHAIERLKVDVGPAELPLVYDDYQQHMNKELSRLDEEKIEAVFGRGLLYQMPLYATYLLAAMGTPCAPADLCAFRLASRSEAVDQAVVAAVLVPNLKPLGDTMSGLLRGAEQKPVDLADYWRCDDDWRRVFEGFSHEFRLPNQMFELLDLRAKSIASGTQPEGRDDDRTVWQKHSPPSASMHRPGQDERSVSAALSDTLTGRTVYETERNIAQRRGLAANQIWIMRAGYQDARVFHFLLFTNKQAELQKELRARGADDGKILDHLRDLARAPHRAVGLAGQLSASRLPTSAVSVVGDPRVFAHMQVHGAHNLEKRDAFVRSMRAEVFFYVRYYRDTYSFPIMVGGRLWGVLELQLRSNKSDSVIRNRTYRDMARRQFLDVVQGMRAAHILGRSIGDALEQEAYRELHSTLDRYVQSASDVRMIPADELKDSIEGFPCFSHVNPVQQTRTDGTGHLFLRCPANAEAAPSGLVIALAPGVDSSPHAEQLRDQLEYAIEQATHVREEIARREQEEQRYREVAHLRGVEQETRQLLRRIDDLRGIVMRLGQRVAPATVGLLANTEEFRLLFRSEVMLYLQASDPRSPRDDRQSQTAEASNALDIAGHWLKDECPLPDGALVSLQPSPPGASFRTLHSARSADDWETTWGHYRACFYVIGLQQGVRIPIEAAIESADMNVREQQTVFSLLKLILHRTHAPDRYRLHGSLEERCLLWDGQLLAVALEAAYQNSEADSVFYPHLPSPEGEPRQEVPPSRPIRNLVEPHVRYSNPEAGSRGLDVRCVKDLAALSGLIPAAGISQDAPPEDPAFLASSILPIGVRPLDLLVPFYQLLVEEFSPRRGGDVDVSGVSLHVVNGAELRLLVECRGRLPLDRLHLDKDGETHGLSGALLRLSRAAGGVRPFCAAECESAEELMALQRRYGGNGVAIGSGGESTWLVVVLPRLNYEGNGETSARDERDGTGMSKLWKRDEEG